MAMKKAAATAIKSLLAASSVSASRVTVEKYGGDTCQTMQCRLTSLAQPLMHSCAMQRELKDMLDKYFKGEDFPPHNYIVKEGKLASQYL